MFKLQRNLIAYSDMGAFEKISPQNWLVVRTGCLIGHLRYMPKLYNLINKYFNSKHCVSNEILTKFKVVSNLRFTLELRVIRHCVKSVCVRDFPVCIFPHLDWIRKDRDYLSAFSSNERKYEPEKLWIRILFTQLKAWLYNPISYSCSL